MQRSTAAGQPGPIGSRTLASASGATPPASGPGATPPASGSGATSPASGSGATPPASASGDTPFDAEASLAPRMLTPEAIGAEIAVVTTGGTIDKAYFDALSAYQIGEPVVRRLLEVAKVAYPYRVVELLRKDSLELTDADRAALHQAISALQARRIVVTHGTDTMADSARALASIADKTIVLTGALSPARFSESDATFNLGMAFAAAQTLPPGVYIAMNGRVFHGDRVRKDRARGLFVPDGT